MTKRSKLPCELQRVEQLGMDPGTAANRLVKDLLFQFIAEKGLTCFRCSFPMTRDTFSVDHKVPWLHSACPREMFFHLPNVAFSHKVCNNAAARKKPKGSRTNLHNAHRYVRHGCRCDECVAAIRAKNKIWKTAARTKAGHGLVRKPESYRSIAGRRAL